MQNRTFFVLLRAIFGEKLKTAPPKEIGSRSCEEHVVIRSEKALEFRMLAGKSVLISVKTFFFFLFGDHLSLVRKNVWISEFGRKISLNFGEDLFILETTCFWSEKTFEFPRNFRELSDKPCDSDSRAMKIQVKVVCTFLTLSKKPPPPPFPNPGYALEPKCCFFCEILIVSVSNW